MKINNRYKTILFHVIFWTLYYISYFYNEDIIIEKIPLGVDITIFITSGIFLFYGLFFCISKFSRKNYKTILIGILRFVAVWLIYVLIKLLVIRFFFPVVLHEHSYEKYSLIDLLLSIAKRSIVWIEGYAIFSIGYYYLISSTKKEHQLRIAAQEKTDYLEKLAAAEKQKNEYERAFLQAQINPHFLYNTLNFFYSEAVKYSEPFAEAIYLLSAIMRYNLHDGVNLNNTVPLEKEIENVQNFIKLNQFRFSNKLNICFTVKGSPENVRFPSMIIMTFVENMFKHGNLTDNEQAAKITLKISAGALLLYFKNKKKKNTFKENSTGVGISNVKKRLENIYNQNFKLTIRETDVDYEVFCYIYANKKNVL